MLKSNIKSYIDMYMKNIFLSNKKKYISLKLWLFMKAIVYP